MTVLDDLERLEREATPGPWIWTDFLMPRRADRDLTIAAVNHLPALIEIARAAEAAVNRADQLELIGFGKLSQALARLEGEK